MTRRVVCCAAVAVLLPFPAGAGTPFPAGRSLRGAAGAATGQPRTTATNHSGSAGLGTQGGQSRGERLCQGGVTVVYHQTSRGACENILRTNFDLAYSSPGNLGRAVYFAENAALTGTKTRHWGCVIEVAVRLGNAHGLRCTGTADGCENGWTWLPVADRGDPNYGGMMNCMGYDSLYTYKHGQESSIFFPDQVVDMIAYPTCGHFGCYARTGPYINGRDTLNMDGECTPSAYPDHCTEDQGREACSAYMETTGCAWTSEWSCPASPVPGRLGVATDDGSEGYRCCCDRGLWQQQVGAAAPSAANSTEAAPPTSTTPSTSSTTLTTSSTSISAAAR